MKYVAFDIETAQVCNESYTDLDVTCIGVYENNDGVITTRAFTPEKIFGSYKRRMGTMETREFLDWLIGKWENGFNIVSYNGLGFDFKVILRGRPYRWAVAERLVLESIDPFWQMFCEKGFGVGLNASARAMNLGSKEGMDGVKAVEMWKKNHTAQLRVIEYVISDARLTGALYERVSESGIWKWITKRGYPTSWKPTIPLLSVEEAAEQPLPDTSWMDDPWPREKFGGWLEGLLDGDDGH